MSGHLPADVHEITLFRFHLRWKMDENWRGVQLELNRHRCCIIDRLNRVCRTYVLKDVRAFVEIDHAEEDFVREGTGVTVTLCNDLILIVSLSIQEKTNVRERRATFVERISLAYGTLPLW